MSSTSNWLPVSSTTRSSFSGFVPGPNPRDTWTTPPVFDGAAANVSVVHSGSWLPPSGSGALTAPAVSACSCVASLGVRGHDENTSAPEAPASHVVNIALPAHVAGAHGG